MTIDPVTIRPETPDDHAAIAELTTRAFAPMPYSRGTEAAIVAGLRDDGALALSLVAVDDGEAGELVGHVAFSRVTIDGEDRGWYGLGPISVAPDRQGRGIGGALIRIGLDELRARGAAGCLLIGDPAYYARFGFDPDPGLRYENAPPEVFQRLAFAAPTPTGRVEFHPAFGAA